MLHIINVKEMIRSEGRSLYETRRGPCSVFHRRWHGDRPHRSKMFGDGAHRCHMPFGRL